MGKKKKPKPSLPAPVQTAPPTTAPVEGQFDLGELWRHPTLLLAAISAAFALLSAVLAIKFHDDMSAGALREPTGMILWTAIAATLFASYWRERSRQRAKAGS